MLKPSYSVVTFVLVVFAILAFSRHAFIGLIPPVNTNPLAYSHQKFLVSAGHEGIQWHIVEENALNEAKSANKPILLVIGASAGKIGRDFDARAFEDVDNAWFVAQNFFCIRIDGFEHPEWLNAVLPISRASLRLNPSYQVWTLDGAGHVLDYIGRNYDNRQQDNHSLYNRLVQARDDFTAGNGKSPIAVDMQRADLQQFDAPTGHTAPGLAVFTQILGDHLDFRDGGFPPGVVQPLYPNAWRFLSLTGNKRLWQESLGPILTSRMVDVQDGGFFKLGLTRDIGQIEFDKGARQNAEMMLTLALEGQIDSDDFDTTIAKGTFDWLMHSALRNGLLAASQEDDENPQGRSPRFSYPTWRLHDLLNASDRDWATDHLGLRPTQNAQMVPYITSRTTILSDFETYDRIMDLLRSGTHTLPTFNDSGYLDVNGDGLARMLQVSRIWGDRGRIASLARLLRKLDIFKEDNDLVHLASDANRRPGYLGDFLGLSDVRLQEYLATGSASALQEGLHYLNLARRLFRGRRPGELNLTRNSAEMGELPNFCVPEIADNLGESCTAQAIRLELEYGRLTADTQSGLDLIREAKLSTSTFAGIANHGGPEHAGYFCAAAEVIDNLYAVAVGPNAERLADELYQQVPTRFVVPALGPFRRDLQARAPGIYLVGKTVDGPYTVPDAAQRLPMNLGSRN